MWKPKGYEATEWDDATDIMRDMQRHEEALKRRLDKWKNKHEGLEQENSTLRKRVEELEEALEGLDKICQRLQGCLSQQQP